MKNKNKLIEVFNTILDLYGDNGIMIISYIYATRFRSILRSKGIYIPFLFLSGRAATGKTEIAKTINSFFSITEDVRDIFYNFKLINKIFNTGTHIIIFDEIFKCEVNKMVLNEISTYYKNQGQNSDKPNLILCSQESDCLESISKYFVKIYLEKNPNITSEILEEKKDKFNLLYKNRFNFNQIFNIDDRKIESEYINNFRDSYCIYEQSLNSFPHGLTQSEHASYYNYTIMLMIFKSIPSDIICKLNLKVDPICYFKDLHDQDLLF